MSNDNNLIEIPIPTVRGMEDILKPSDRPVMGEQRLVKFLPAPGTDQLFPCIWMSPYRVTEPFHGSMEPLVKCLLLISKGPPHPDVVCIGIRQDDIGKFPVAPVEW